jgi:hypothetical protein
MRLLPGEWKRMRALVLLTSDTSVVYLLLSDKSPAVAARVLNHILHRPPIKDAKRAWISALGAYMAYILLPPLAMLLVFYSLIHTISFFVNCDTRCLLYLPCAFCTATMQVDTASLNFSVTKLPPTLFYRILGVTCPKKSPCMI